MQNKLCVYDKDKGKWCTVNSIHSNVVYLHESVKLLSQESVDQIRINFGSRSARSLEVYKLVLQ